MSFFNVYNDADRARAYATLEYPGTYYLAFRDLPALIGEHVPERARPRRALDFGCGAGRSTRFLKKLGFDTTGIDISSNMIDLARQADPDGNYVLVNSGDFASVAAEPFDLVFSAFAFDNIPGTEHRCDLLRELGHLLTKEAGRIVLLGSTPEIYVHEWASFSTRDFPENRNARSGDTVHIVMKDVPDQRPVVDLIWRHEDYVKLFASAGLELVAHHLPLGRPDEPYPWLTETAIAPWMVYVLRKNP